MLKMRCHFVLLIILITTITEIQGQSTYAVLLKAKSLTERNRSEETVILLSEAILSSSDYRLFVERARAYILQKKYTEATADLQKANSLNKGSGSYDLARLYALNGDAAVALDNLEEHIRSVYKKQEKEIFLDQAFAAIENTPEWRLFWKTDWYTTPEKEIARLEYELNTGNTEEAVLIVAQLSSDYYDDQDYVYAKALLEYYSKDYSSALDVLSADPVSAMSDKNVRLLARIHYDAGNFIAASADYSELIKRELPEARLLLSRADSYRKSGERAKALADLTMYLELYPDDGEALSMAGKTESETGDNIKALEYFSRNIELNPSVASNYIDRANAYFASSSWKYAIDDYSMALDLQPGNSDAYLNKGISLLNTGRLKDACHDFRQSLKLENKRATNYLSRYCLA